MFWTVLVILVLYFVVIGWIASALHNAGKDLRQIGRVERW